MLQKSTVFDVCYSCIPNLLWTDWPICREQRGYKGVTIDLLKIRFYVCVHACVCWCECVYCSSQCLMQQNQQQ
uniref:Uncharacterized protein n=1 Tax=Anguilla anguilla TaxID=7936 RepID=A0A0E9X3T6_ANGAN